MHTETKIHAMKLPTVYNVNKAKVEIQMKLRLNIAFPLLIFVEKKWHSNKTQNLWLTFSLLATQLL